MPFSLSRSLTLSTVVWFLYGLLIKDKYVTLPNVLGFTFGVIQMALYMLYMNKTPVVAEGKDVSTKLPAGAKDHVVNITKINSALPEKSLEVYPVTEMGNPMKSCSAAVAVPVNRDIGGGLVAHCPAVRVV